MSCATTGTGGPEAPAPATCALSQADPLQALFDAIEFDVERGLASLDRVRDRTANTGTVDPALEALEAELQHLRLQAQELNLIPGKQPQADLEALALAARELMRYTGELAHTSLQGAPLPHAPR